MNHALADTHNNIDVVCWRKVIFFFFDSWLTFLRAWPCVRYVWYVRFYVQWTNSGSKCRFTSSCLLFEKWNSSRTTTATKKKIYDKVTVKRKTKSNKKETKFLQSTVEIDKSNKQYYNGHQKKAAKEKKRKKKKLMRTTIATPDYRQCSMYQYDEGDRLLALVYHSFWHTYFDKLPLFTHFNKRDSHIPVLFGYLHIMLIFCFAFFFCLTSIFHFDNLWCIHMVLVKILFSFGSLVSYLCKPFWFCYTCINLYCTTYII